METDKSQDNDTASASAPSGDGNDFAAKVSVAKSAVISALEQMPSGADANQLTEASAEAHALIQWFQGLSDQQRARHSFYLTLGLQVIAVCLAGITLVLTELSPQDANPFLTGILCVILTVLGSQLAASVWLIRTYAHQDGFRYPFLSGETRPLSNTWKWFYYGALSNPGALGRESSERARRESVLEFLKDEASYVGNFGREMKDPAERVRANLQQAFLLLVHNGYMNRFTLRLASIWKAGLTATLWLAAVSFLGLLACKSIALYLHSRGGHFPVVLPIYAEVTALAIGVAVTGVILAVKRV